MAGTGTAHLRGEDALLTVEELVVEYKTRKGVVQGVSGVSFDVIRGETFGIVGESGCGKSTTGRASLAMQLATSGRITYAGEELMAGDRESRQRTRGDLQMIFQDPVASLNPRRAVKDLVVEGLVIAGVSAEVRTAKAAELLERVGLPAERFANMLPRQLSGGQAQRVAIARALAVDPTILLCDEPVSSLDVSVQAQVLNLLEELKQNFDLTIIFIAHDLGVVKAVSDTVMVMYLGKVCEVGEPDQMYASPRHPYTQALLDSVPSQDPAHLFGPPLEGDVPSPLNPPSGCRFRTRCPRAQELCAVEEPRLRELAPQQYAACHFPLEPRGAVATTEVGEG